VIARHRLGHFKDCPADTRTSGLPEAGAASKTSPDEGGHRDCLYDDGKGLFRTKPGIIVRRGQEIVLIIDTKWKRMTPRIDDPKQGVSQADVYQLMAYGQLYDCPRMMLLYPDHHALGRAGQCQDYAIGNSYGDRTFTVATVDVAAGVAEVKAALINLVAIAFALPGLNGGRQL
jgi:5-methylcytosine-specific restriction enzyme subunit McrC